MLLSEISGLFCSRNGWHGDGSVGGLILISITRAGLLNGAPEVSVIVRVILRTGKQQSVAGSNPEHPFLPKKYVSVG